MNFQGRQVCPTVSEKGSTLRVEGQGMQEANRKSQKSSLLLCSATKSGEGIMLMLYRPKF